MQLNDYQRLAQRTANTTNRRDKLINACLGLSGETGEVCDDLKKHLYQGHELNRVHLMEELGDVLWYVAEGASGLGVSLEDVAESNIGKLMKRYPDGFSKERSVNRDDA